MSNPNLENAKNAALAERFGAALVPNYKPQPIALVRGEGCHVFDSNGSGIVPSFLN